MKAFLSVHKPQMIKAEDVRKSNVRWSCCYRYQETIFGVKDAPCLSCRDKRLKVRKQEKDEVKYKGCSERKCLSMFFWGEWKTHHSSAVPLATALPAQHLNMRTLTSLLVLVPPIHPPFPHFSIPSPHPLWSALFPPCSRNPPTSSPSSAHPHLIPILQRLVINVSFNCHAHFYAH